MDLAYDNIVKDTQQSAATTSSASAPASASSSSDQQKPEPPTTLNDDLQDAYRAFSNSPWGTWLGGQVGKVVKQVCFCPRRLLLLLPVDLFLTNPLSHTPTIKQGGEVYREAQQEVTSLGVDASRGLARLRERAISLTTTVPPLGGGGSGSNDDNNNNNNNSVSGSSSTNKEGGGEKDNKGKDKEKDAGDRDAETTPTTARDGKMDEAMSQSETYLSRLRAEAAKRLKDIQRAEDAADEALLSFGKNLRDFLQDAIVLKPGDESGGSGSGSGSGTGSGSGQSGGQRFESKDESGKRVIHTSRYDAQLHVVHTSEKSFVEDPASDEFAAWAAQSFDAAAPERTDAIAADLAKYPDLRASMERLVPDRVPYPDFWKRYYFLRHSIETAEARRRDLLKGG